MTHTIQFDLVAPDSKVVSEPVTMAVIPGTEGDFGVLSGHMPLVANVGMGIVEIYRDDMKTVNERIFIAGGVADVTAGQCTLLAEQAANLKDLKKDDIEAQIKDLNTQIEAASDSTDKDRLHKKLAVLNAMLQLSI